MFKSGTQAARAKWSRQVNRRLQQLLPVSVCLPCIQGSKKKLNNRKHLPDDGLLLERTDDFLALLHDAQREQVGRLLDRLWPRRKPKGRKRNRK